MLIIFGAQNPEEISHQKIVNLSTSPAIMSPHYLVKCNSSDAACRIIDHTHTHNTSTGSCQSRPLIAGEDYRPIVHVVS